MNIERFVRMADAYKIPRPNTKFENTIFKNVKDTHGNIYFGQFDK